MVWGIRSPPGPRPTAQTPAHRTAPLSRGRRRRTRIQRPRRSRHRTSKRCWACLRMFPRRKLGVRGPSPKPAARAPSSSPHAILAQKCDLVTCCFVMENSIHALCLSSPRHRPILSCPSPERHVYVVLTPQIRLNLDWWRPHWAVCRRSWRKTSELDRCER